MVIKKITILILTLVCLLVSCAPAVTSEPTGSPNLPRTSTPTTSPLPTQSETPTSTPDLDHLDPASILFEQNFERGRTHGLSFSSLYWNLISDETGNKILCNNPGDFHSNVIFGESDWKDYAVEVKVKELEIHENPWVGIFTRYDPDMNRGYYGSLNFETRSADLALNEPYRLFGHQSFPMVENTWYTLRLEIAGQKIRYYIDGRLVGWGIDGSRSQGEALLTASTNMKVCIDDIRAWLLTETGGIGRLPTATITPIPINSAPEIVTDQAATGDGGNAWGGHQTRIVRTQYGVFTAYTVKGSGAGGDYLNREWRLAWRQQDGTWPVVAQGESGREPVNLLASPDGTLHIIGWPGGMGTMWSGKPQGDQINMIPESIPGVAQSNWPYNSAGINGNGDICVLSSVGGQEPGGKFMWACKVQPQGKWIFQTSWIDYRYCYTYVFPGPGGQLKLVSNRDVLWKALGYIQPNYGNGSDYVFDGIGYWRTNNIVSEPLIRVFFAEELPSVQFPFVYYDAQEDAYLDTQGNMHILYYQIGPSTQGTLENRHMILSPEGMVLHDVLLPNGIGQYTRIFQDEDGYFYLLSSNGFLYPAGKNGISIGEPKYINLMGYPVEVSGFGISVPRTGTPISDVLDVVYPSDDGTKWIYFQIPLPGK